MSKGFSFLAKKITQSPKKIIFLLLLFTLVIGFGVTKVQVDLGQGTMISHKDPIYKATEEYHDEFGSDTLFILLSGKQGDLLSTDNLSAINKLQSELVKKKEIQSAFSYYNMIENGTDQATKIQMKMKSQLQEAVEKAVQEAAARGATPAQQQDAAQKAQIAFMKKVNEQSGANLTSLQAAGAPSLQNEKFVKGLVLDKDGNVNEMFKTFMPQNGKHALIIMKVEGGIPYSELSDLTEEVSNMTKEAGFSNLDTKISGTPKIYGAIYNSMMKDMSIMLGLSLVLMAAILFMVFPVKWRLLALPVVLLSLFWTIGIMGYIGVPMSMVTMAILPILIGLGTDFAIQFHNRYDEELKAGKPVKEAILQSIQKMGPAVGIAVFSMTLGFITLLISKVPMIQHFGIMLSVGVIVSYTVTLLLMYAVFMLRDRKVTPETVSTPSKMEGFMEKIATLTVKKPILLLAIGVLLSAGGFYIDHSLKIETNIEKLMPQEAPELKELNELRKIIGSTNEISFILKSGDVTDPRVVKWIADYEEQQRKAHPEIETATSIASIMKQANKGEVPETKAEIESILAQVPDELKSNILSKDKESAAVSFTIGNIGMKEQADLLNHIEKDINPPSGVEMKPAGSNVINIKSVGSMTENRHLSAGIGVIAIIAGLMLAYRRWKMAMYPVLPIVLVVGWSSLMMFLLGIEINPLTAVLGSLVLGIGSEFTILIMERYQEELENGLSREKALIKSISKIGMAITASGLTVMAGFSTLIFSEFVMLRSFGITTVFDTFLCLISSLFILPAIIVLTDKRKSASEMTK
ncbi:hydrophobe/amphiphile efflux-3 (HAE3) family protein [Fictibacillus halophilus]|uniref:Hydrophobe/amphiphile efflux-3 (HAE3) family protein n=1 Tax=Fictibacillus halophilus TaxID=1610490 RepID=A0ABV2LIA1_9BACL